MNLFKNLTRLMCLSLLVFAVACDSNVDLIPDVEPEDGYAAEFVLTDDSGDASQTVFISDLDDDATDFEVLVSFASASAKMRRLYMTENVLGAGDEPFELALSGLDKKADGSLDLSGDEKSGFEFVLTFNVSDAVTEGNVVYNIWTTTGRGDYRDVDNSFAVGVGTLIVNYGGNNPETDLKEYSAKILAAPLNSLESESFISLLDGQLYEIAEGREYAAFWDFGYFYGADDASFASASAYEEAFGSTSSGTPFIDVDVIAGTDSLNNCYFASSTLIFADAEKEDDLTFGTPSSESINDLAVGDVIQFVDNYGKKGLIEVEDIELGSQDLGYTSDAYIEINIKVQP